MNSKKSWVKNTYNEVLVCDEFYISYNPNLNANEDTQLLNELGSLVGSLVGLDLNRDGTPETALVKNGEFYILKGDFRKQYSKLFPKGFDACKKFFDEQEALHGSDWSTNKIPKKNI